MSLPDLLEIPNLAWICKARWRGLVHVSHGVQIGEGTEGDASSAFDLGNWPLVVLVPAEHELLLTDEGFLRHRVTRRTQPACLVVNESDHLPEGNGNLDTESDRVVIGQKRPGEYTNAHVVLACIVYPFREPPSASVVRSEVHGGRREEKGSSKRFAEIEGRCVDAHSLWASRDVR